MRLFSLDGPRARAITEFGSAGVTIFPLARPDGGVHLARMLIEAGGQIGAHPGDTPQLFAVLVGEGWVAGSDGRQVAIRTGEAAFWEAGEAHSTGSEQGMTALVIEAESLEPAEFLAELTETGTTVDRSGG